MKLTVLSAALACLALAAPPARTPALVARGRQVYALNCQLCHGDKGDGNGPAGQALNPRPRNYAVLKDYKNGPLPENIFRTLSEGLPGTTMVSFAHLPEEDRWALAYFITDTFQPRVPARRK